MADWVANGIGALEIPSGCIDLSLVAFGCQKEDLWDSHEQLSGGLYKKLLSTQEVQISTVTLDQQEVSIDLLHPNNSTASEKLILAQGRAYQYVSSITEQGAKDLSIEVQEQFRVRRERLGTTQRQFLEEASRMKIQDLYDSIDASIEHVFRDGLSAVDNVRNSKTKLQVKIAAPDVQHVEPDRELLIQLYVENLIYELVRSVSLNPSILRIYAYLRRQYEERQHPGRSRAGKIAKTRTGAGLNRPQAPASSSAKRHDREAKQTVGPVKHYGETYKGPPYWLIGLAVGLVLLAFGVIYSQHKKARKEQLELEKADRLKRP